MGLGLTPLLLTKYETIFNEAIDINFERIGQLCTLYDYYMYIYVFSEGKYL